MCGIIGIIGHANAVEYICAGLTFLQHRGQDAAGIATMSDSQILVDKGQGLAEEVFNKNRINGLTGNTGIGHVRYSTAGNAHVLSEIQPFYVNQPFGITLAHNGNLIHSQALRQWLVNDARRHISSNSDSEVLLNVLAYSIAELSRKNRPMPNLLFDAVSEVHRHCTGSYAVVALIAGHGLLAFRDPNGIRPLVIGKSESGGFLAASESVVFQPLGFRHWKDVAPGEAVFIDQQRILHSQQCANNSQHQPCIFEYIYFARPDSKINGVSVYETRLNMGRKLAGKIRRDNADLKIDCIIPVPDSGRIAAMELAHTLDIPYREGLVKNRYIGRTFISAGQINRRNSVRKKLNIIESEFYDKNVLLVDDSIVRGTTGRELVNLARAAGAKKVYFASAAPPVRYPNIYGIDIPTKSELLAGHRNEKEIAAYLGADCVIYQTLEDLIAAVNEVNTTLTRFETSCFDGNYRVGNITDDYFTELKKQRGAHRDNPLAQGDLPLL